jgi:hypothetical protein
MEITCTRCHQAIEDGSTYCAMCGLPQLVYQADTGAGAVQPERRTEPVRDAASVAWKPAMSFSARLAIPAGVVFGTFCLSSIANDSFFLGLLFLMSAVAAWVVAIYVRSLKQAWITIGAGARIGMVTGIMSAWTSTAVCGLLMYGARYWFGYGKSIDDSWTQLVKGMVPQWQSSGADPGTVTQMVTMLLSSEGRAIVGLAGVFMFAGLALVFSTAGGALSARFLARSRQPEI